MRTSARSVRPRGSATRQRRPAQVTSLRTRWTRAFALLTTLVVLSGGASLIGSRLMVDIFHDSAVQVERTATVTAELRADIIAHSLLLTAAVTPATVRQIHEDEAAIRAGFSHAISLESTPRPQHLLEKARAEWQALIDAAGPASNYAAVEIRGLAVAEHAPKILTLLDQAGSAGRDAVRADLAAAGSTERKTMLSLAAFALMAILLAVRLSRRLSTEVLRPVGILRDSANHLAAGELDHRVVVDRADELGDLATSFNTMADAIAGNQRSLTLQATTDSLSGLANRAAFRTRLQDVLARTNRRRGNQAVLFVDLDDFKDVNDTLGHAAGDELLRVVAGRLLETVRPGDLVARLGGDEFALLLDSLIEPDAALRVAERVVTALAKPVQIGEHWAHVGASVGLAIRTERSTFDGLMREADVAMYAAKAKGKNRVEAYDAALDDLAGARMELKGGVDTAAAQGELVLDYQPMVELTTGEIVGVEALVRWQHPTRGLLPPSAFIAVAEETGAIISIGSFVLETAAHQLHDWQRRYRQPDLRMSVNVSVCQLNKPGFVDEVRGVLRATRIDPTRLILEVTESVMADPDGAVPGVLAALRLLGVQVALDDFGTGYSSIGYLQQLPVDILKIDRSFVSGITADRKGNALLGAIVAMARSLDLHVIPEGIEDPDQLITLRAMGCHVGQGFFLARPAPAEAIDALLAAGMPLPHVGLFHVIDEPQLDFADLEDAEDVGHEDRVPVSARA